MNHNTVITLSHISKSYGKHNILSDITMEIQKGEIFGLLGPSGCGKSTTVKIMSGILKSDQGIVKILDRKMPDFYCMSQIGYMAQTAALYPTMTGYENLRFFGSLYGLKRQELQKRIEVSSSLVGLTSDLKKLVSTYSGGMKQRLSLAITLLHNPSILILDEPTVGIDPVLRKAIWEDLFKLKQQGVTIIITTHVMDEVSHCNRLSMMQEGKLLITGTPAELQETAGCDSIEDTFIYFSTKGGSGR